MRAYVFDGNLEVLVNGYSTQESSTQIGLKQWDPLAHFFFLLMDEGLGGLVDKAEEVDLYLGLGWENLIW